MPLGELALVDGVEEGAPRAGGAAIGDVAGDEDDVGVAERRRVEHALELAVAAGMGALDHAHASALR